MRRRQIPTRQNDVSLLPHYSNGSVPSSTSPNARRKRPLRSFRSPSSVIISFVLVALLIIILGYIALLFRVTHPDTQISSYHRTMNRRLITHHAQCPLNMQINWPFQLPKNIDILDPIHFAEMSFEDGVPTHRVDKKSGDNSKKWHEAQLDENWWEFDDDEVDTLLEEWYPNCRLPSHHAQTNPTCNKLHENDMHAAIVENVAKLLGTGAFRSTFRMPDSSDDGEGVTLKGARYTDRFYTRGFTDHLETQRRDVLIMDLLSSSPRISNVYGYCAMTSLSELLLEEMEDYIIPPDTSYNPPDTEGPLRSLNKLIPAQKLELALEFAKPLADLHGHKNGCIMHVDIKPDQMMRGKDGIIKIMDFNRAETLPFNEEEGKYCPIDEGVGATIWRAPEELAGEYIDEKADIWNYCGNILYSILTGLWIHSQVKDEDKYRENLEAGEKPFYDKRWKHNSYGDAVLVKILDECLVFEPEERRDIFWIVDYLERAIKVNNDLDENAAEDEWKKLL